MQRQTQIPFGNDNQKGKGDDSSDGNDKNNSNDKNDSNDKSNGKNDRRSFDCASLRMTSFFAGYLVSVI